MTNPWEGQAFLFMWIGFLLLMTGGIGAFFFWGVRSGQFANQERARFLALDAEIPDTLPKSETGQPSDSLPRRGRAGEGERNRLQTDGRHAP